MKLRFPNGVEIEGTEQEITNILNRKVFIGQKGKDESIGFVQNNSEKNPLSDINSQETKSEKPESRVLTNNNSVVFCTDSSPDTHSPIKDLIDKDYKEKTNDNWNKYVSSQTGILSAEKGRSE